MSDERRMKDEADVPRGLLAALEAGKRDLPSDAEMRALEASVLLALREGGGGGPAKVAAKATSGVQLGVAGVVLVSVAAVALWSATRSPEAPRHEETVVDAPRDAAVIVDAGPDAPWVDASDAGSDAGRARRARPDAGVVTSIEAPPDRERSEEEIRVADEIALLRAARVALRTDPAEALAITERMAAVPSPAWAEERERVAIEALDALGRDAEARARFSRFVERFPSSAYRTRLEEILAAP